jgi:hypothetical protein
VVVPLAHQAAYLNTYPTLPIEDYWPAPYWFIDTGMAALMMLLTAVDEGLGACLFWTMPPAGQSEEGGVVKAHLAAFRGEFGIPEEYTPVSAIAIGYRPVDLAPQNPDLKTRRRDTDTLIHRGQWAAPGGPSAVTTTTWLSPAMSRGRQRTGRRGLSPSASPCPVTGG